jgi:hypothetical protein
MKQKRVLNSSALHRWTHRLANRRTDRHIWELIVVILLLKESRLNLCLGRLEERDHSQDLSVDGGIILKLISKKSRARL